MKNTQDNRGSNSGQNGNKFSSGPQNNKPQNYKQEDEMDESEGSMETEEMEGERVDMTCPCCGKEACITICIEHK